MYVRLNLATKPLFSHRRFLTYAAAAGLLGTILFLGLGWKAYQIRSANAEIRRQSQAVEAEIGQYMQKRAELDDFFNRHENTRLQERASFTKSVIEARSFNWTKMFMDLEHTLPAGVHIVRIEPKMEKGVMSVHLLIGAVDQDSKLKVLKAFEESSSFTQVALIDEHLATPGQSGNDVVTLELTAVYARAS